MSELIKIVYVGKKPMAFDNVAGSGKCWSGKGDVQEVNAEQAKRLIKHEDQWALADATDLEAVSQPAMTSVTDEEGKQVDVENATLGKPLEKMTKAELVAFAKAKWGKDLDATKAKTLLIDAIEEFERDLEPVAQVG